VELLDVRTDVGPGASPAHLEALLRGLRVATDVAYGAEVERIRRAATARMKFPTDQELRRALDRFRDGDENGPRARARSQLDARRFARKEGGRLPPGLWLEYWYGQDRPGDKQSPAFSHLARAGYDRVAGTPFPLGTAIGLDVLDPVLYEALVADDLAQALPERVGVRSLSYENPFWASIFGKGKAEKTVSTTVEVIEVARDFGSKRKIAQADAAVAEATVPHRVAESGLDVELRRQEVIEAQLRNERLALENARLRQSLGAEEQRRLLIDHAIHRGDIAIADAIRALEPGDVEALAHIGQRQLEIEQRSAPDE
jgi:hypothetical protein